MGEGEEKIILGVDTATDMASLGLVEGEKVRGEINVNLHHRHSERLLPNIKYLLQEVQLDRNELDGLAVGLGPGSFTGLRIGVTTIKTMAQFLEIPVVGISTLEILVTGIVDHEGWLLPLLDARNQRVYTAFFSGRDAKIKPARETEDRALSLEELLAELKQFDREGKYHLVGNGAKNYQDFFCSTDLNLNFVAEGNHFPRGGMVAHLGRMYLAAGKSDNINELSPIYLKQAHTSPEKK